MAIGRRHRAADLEHLFQDVAAGVLEIDQDDVGIDAVNARQEIVHLRNVLNAGKARVAQSLLEDCSSDRAFVDDDYLERRSAAIQYSHSGKTTLACVTVSLKALYL